jgi:hypothetical protein
LPINEHFLLAFESVFLGQTYGLASPAFK